MNINTHKLVRLLLPTFMRGNRITEFIRVMLLQLEKSHNAFNANVPDWLYKANANASVISLTHHIRRELDVEVLITAQNGNPIDYLVTVTGLVDYGKLSKLLDTYGLSGKSYVFVLGDIIFESQYINHVCEIELADNLLTVNYASDMVYVTSQHPVTSNLDIALHVSYTSGNVTSPHVHILKGASNSETITLEGLTGAPSISGISPVSDFNYTYTV